MTRELIKTDKNGTKYFNDRVVCDRCGGDGVYKWGAMISWCGGPAMPQYAGTCFKCNGAGKVWEIVKEYTPEYRAKLDAQNEKRKAKQRAKWEAERAEREAERARIEAERRKAEEERIRAEEARKAISQHIGEIGERIEVEVTLEKEFSFEVPSFKGWGTDTKTIYIFADAAGNKFVWKSTACLWQNDDDDHMKPVCEGDTVKIKATVKDHTEYKDEKQTEIQRVKVI